ncbi:mevalonate kinase isoform X2 [Bacillus rossius redtenbacheri]
MSLKQNETCFSVSAPGKIILHGEHSVVYGKTALAASISRRTRVTWKVNNRDDRLKLSLSAINLEKEYNLKNIHDCLLAVPPPIVEQSELASFNVGTPELLDLAELLPVLTKFIPDAPSLTKEHRNPLLAFFTLFVGMLSSVAVEIKSCSISVTSELDIGAGLGSSASYSVALAAGFLQFIRTCVERQHKGQQNITREGFKTIPSICSPNAEFSDGERDLISRWAYQCERIMHGNPSGIDNLVCTYGFVLQFRKNVSRQGVTWKKLPPVKELSVLLVNTKVSRSTAALVEKVAQKKAKFPSVIEAVFQVIDQVALSASSVFESMSDANSSELEQHLHTLEELVDLNQGQLASLGVSHPRLDRVCAAAAARGMHAKLTGAGGGGNAFVLVRPSPCDAEELRRELEEEGYDCFVTGIGREGVTVDSL